MKLFLNQVMNSGTANNNNNNNNNIETTSEESSSSIQLHNYQHEYEIEFCCNGTKDGTNDLDDTSDDISALTMPSCLCNRTNYNTTQTNMRMNMFLSIETQLLDNITDDHTIPGEIRFASLSGSGGDDNNNHYNSNDDDDELSQNYDDRIIRRSFAFDEDDDDYVHKATTISSDKDCDDDTDDHSYDDGLDEHVIDEDCATRNHRHLSNAFDGCNSTSQPPCGPVKNPLTGIGGTEKCNKKSKALYRMPIKLNRQGWWTNTTMHRNKQLGKRSRKAFI